MLMIIVCLLLLLLRRRLRRLRRLCCRRRRRVRRHRLLLYHIPQRHETPKHGDPGSVDPRSGRVGGCPEGLTIRRHLQVAGRVESWSQFLQTSVNHLQNANCGQLGAAASPLGHVRIGRHEVELIPRLSRVRRQRRIVAFVVIVMGWNANGTIPWLTTWYVLATFHDNIAATTTFASPFLAAILSIAGPFASVVFTPWLLSLVTASPLPGGLVV